MYLTSCRASIRVRVTPLCQFIRQLVLLRLHCVLTLGVTGSANTNVASREQRQNHMTLVSVYHPFIYSIHRAFYKTMNSSAPDKRLPLNGLIAHQGTPRGECTRSQTKSFSIVGIVGPGNFCASTNSLCHNADGHRGHLLCGDGSFRACFSIY